MNDEIFETGETNRPAADPDSPGTPDRLTLEVGKRKDEIDAYAGAIVPGRDDHRSAGEFLSPGDQEAELRGPGGVKNPPQVLDADPQGDIDILGRTGFPVKEHSLPPYNHIGDLVFNQRCGDADEESFEHGSRPRRS